MLDLSLTGVALRHRPAGAVPPPPPPPPPPPMSAVTAVSVDGWSASLSSPPASFAPDEAPETISLSRAGFDAAGQAVTRSEQLVLTARVRQPYPNQGQLTADRVALSDYVYATDTIAGVANQSAETSPKPIVNHVTPDRFVAGNQIGGAVQPIEIVAAHRDARGGRQVACARCTISDGVSTISAVVATTTVSGRAGDCNPVVVHALPLTDISALADGLCWYDWEVFPHVGGAASVNRSAENGTARREFTRRYFLKNAALNAAPPLAYVALTGNDAAGIVSANAGTAAAAPFATVLGAINALHTALAGTTGLDGAEIRIGAGTFVLGSTAAARAQKAAALTITRDPAVARGDARVSFGAAGFRPRLGSGGTLATPLTSGALRFRDLSIVRTGTLALQGEATAQLELVFEEVAFDAAGINNPMLSNAHSGFYGATIANPAALGPGTFEHRIFRGVQADLNFATWEGWLTVGCALSRPGPTSRLATRSYSGAIWAYNMFLSPTTSAVLLHLGGSADVNGAAIVQNLVEFTSAAQVAVLRVSGDSDTGNNSHVVIHNNSFAGFFIQGRANIFYDDGPTPRSSRLQSCKGNIHVQINTKGDLFAADGTRTGNWAYLYGVGCRGEFSQFIDANTGGIGTSFAQAWPGQKAKIGTSATVRQEPLFVDYRGTTAGPTAGAGGGNYRLQAGSPAKAMLSTALLSHDLAGATRPALGDSAGAYA